MLSVEALKAELRQRDIPFLVVAEHLEEPKTLAVYMHGDQRYVGDDEIIDLIGEIPGVRGVSTSTPSPAILLVRVETGSGNEKSPPA